MLTTLCDGGRLIDEPHDAVRRVRLKTRLFIYRLGLKLHERTPSSLATAKLGQLEHTNNDLSGSFMAQIAPKGTKCAGCDVPIKNFELFVVYRSGREVQFWHKRSCILEEYGGELRFNQVHQVHEIHAVNAT